MQSFEGCLVGEWRGALAGREMFISGSWTLVFMELCMGFEQVEV
jgi:hypothetical protein